MDERVTTAEKLAEALTKTKDVVAEYLKEVGHDPSVGIDSRELIYALEAADEALAAYEAEKASTPDDVREAIDYLDDMTGKLDAHWRI